MKNIHLHLPHSDSCVEIARLAGKLDVLTALVEEQGHRIMSNLDEITSALAAANTALEESNATTTEIAGDVDALIAEVLAAGNLPVDAAAAVQAKAEALSAKLRGVNEKYPAQPVEPGV